MIPTGVGEEVYQIAKSKVIMDNACIKRSKKVPKGFRET
jgi:hypothetical protein